MHIYLVDAARTLLGTMSQKSQEEALAALSELGVNIKPSVAVKDFKEDMVYLSNNKQIIAKTLIWVPG